MIRQLGELPQPYRAAYTITEKLPVPLARRAASQAFSRASPPHAKRVQDVLDGCIVDFFNLRNQTIKTVYLSWHLFGCPELDVVPVLVDPQ